MKSLKRINFWNLCLALILIFANMAAANEASDRVRAVVIKNDTVAQGIASITSTSYPDDYVDEKQIVEIGLKNKTFYLVPSTTYIPKASGCHLTVVSNERKINERIVLQESADALTCEAVIALFSCNVNFPGVGVIYGLRLGADKYFTRASFFEVKSESQLVLNKDLSNKISDIDTAVNAKKKLGCK
jgi:hypothetical protein